MPVLDVQRGRGLRMMRTESPRGRKGRRVELPRRGWHQRPAARARAAPKARALVRPRALGRARGRLQGRARRVLPWHDCSCTHVSHIVLDGSGRPNEDFAAKPASRATA